MAEMIFAVQQDRDIPKEDKIFGINRRAKAMAAERGKDKVVNATIGALINNGELVVLSSVSDVFKSLGPKDFAEYAPIAGTPEFREAIKKDAFGNYKPASFTEAIATPGGTGAIRNTIANFSEIGDKVLVPDWYWAPYKTIASEIGRQLETFRLFSDERDFNSAALAEKVEEILSVQDRLVVILNTPAHNPTGYCMSKKEWERVKKVFESVSPEKKITILVDTAYIDFAGDEEEYRDFIPVLEEMPDNVLPIIAYSLSKAYTLYGMRCGAMICMAKTAEMADEFKRVCEFSSRGTWSNCTKAPQVILSRIYADPVLKKKVDDERKEYRDMLLRRGKAFEQAAEECGLEIVPFEAGFFASVPCDDPEKVSAELEKEGIFLVPLSKGVRVSVASITEDVCRMLPQRIFEAIKKE